MLKDYEYVKCKISKCKIAPFSFSGVFVSDPGHFSLRVGFAGEDCPKSEIPSVVGFCEEPEPVK